MITTMGTVSGYSSFISLILITFGHVLVNKTDKIIEACVLGVGRTEFTVKWSGVRYTQLTALQSHQWSIKIITKHSLWKHEEVLILFWDVTEILKEKKMVGEGHIKLTPLSVQNNT